MIVDDDDEDEDGNGKDSLPERIRRRLFLRDLTLPTVTDTYYQPLFYLLGPLSTFLSSFKCLLGRESGVSGGSGHLDVERAR